MNRELAVRIADAVLYEGCILYPYRASALKNRQRWSFGILYPPDYEEVGGGTEHSSMHSECLLRVNSDCRLGVNLRFLQLQSEKVGLQPECGGVEDVPLSFEFAPDLGWNFPQRFRFNFPESSVPGDVHTPDTIVNAKKQIQGAVIVDAGKIDQELLKVNIDVHNETALSSSELHRDSALTAALLSAHLILTVDGAEFVSLLDPPDEFRSHVSACRNVGNFPVLVGVEGERDMMLCSPIILYDYPQIAPESAGDFYDCTEMDEMLTLRVMTLTDQEKNEVRLAGERARNLLKRTEQSAHEQLTKTHGAIRSLRPVSKSDGLES